MTFGIILSVILTGVSLAMDAFAVSVCDGMIYRHLEKRKLVIFPVTFGLFQALMPIIGFYVGMAVIKYIETFDHWLAFGILLFIGGNMIYEAIKKLRSKSQEMQQKQFTVKEVLIQGVATSIDALAVGFSLNSMLGGVDNVQAWAWASVGIIGVITFCISAVGVVIGVKVGELFKKRVAVAEIIGGAVLILIAVKIVLEAYGVIKF